MARIVIFCLCTGLVLFILFVGLVAAEKPQGALLKTDTVFRTFTGQSQAKAEIPESSMPIVRPKENIDYKIHTVPVDPDINYTILELNRGRRLVPVVPYQFRNFIVPSKPKNKKRSPVPHPQKFSMPQINPTPPDLPKQ